MYFFEIAKRLALGIIYIPWIIYFSVLFLTNLTTMKNNVATVTNYSQGCDFETKHKAAKYKI